MRPRLRLLDNQSPAPRLAPELEHCPRPRYAGLAVLALVLEVVALLVAIVMVAR